MNRRFLIGITIIVVGIVAIIVSQGGSLTTLADAVSTTPIVPGEVGIKLKPGLAAADRASLSHAHGALGIKNDWSAFGWLNLNVAPGQEQAIADQFKADPRVVQVALDHYACPAESTQPCSPAPTSGPPSSSSDTGAPVSGTTENGANLAGGQLGSYSSAGSVSASDLPMIAPQTGHPTG